MIEIKAVDKSFGTKKVLENITVNLYKGNFTTIIGANGSGKSTLLSMIAKLDKVDSGKITLNDQEIETFSRENFSQQISILKQSNNPHMRFTIRELISFGRYPYSKGKLTNKDHLKIIEVIKYFDLEKIADNYIDQISGGQKQLAFIAMLAAQDTDYMLLDEPLNNLDIKHSKQVMEILKCYAKDYNKSIVLVIHDINFASVYSDYIIALKDGKIVAAADKQKVIHQDILKEVYDVDFEIQEINNNKICFFY